MAGEVHRCVDERCIAHRLGMNHPRHPERIRTKDFTGEHKPKENGDAT